MASTNGFRVFIFSSLGPFTKHFVALIPLWLHHLVRTWGVEASQPICLGTVGLGPFVVTKYNIPLGSPKRGGGDEPSAAQKNPGQISDVIYSHSAADVAPAAGTAGPASCFCWSLLFKTSDENKQDERRVKSVMSTFSARLPQCAPALGTAPFPG